MVGLVLVVSRLHAGLPFGIAASDQSRRVNKNMATVIIPESHGLPQATLHFINEGTLTDAWRLDVPDSMDATALQSKLNEVGNAIFETFFAVRPGGDALDALEAREAAAQ